MRILLALSIFIFLLFINVFVSLSYSEELWEKYPQCFDMVVTPFGTSYREKPGCIPDETITPEETIEVNSDTTTITIPPHGSTVILFYKPCSDETGVNCKEVSTPFGTILMDPPKTIEPEKPKPPPPPPPPKPEEKEGNCFLDVINVFVKGNDNGE